MSYFEVYKQSDKIYLIRDKLGVLSTLVIGSKKALLLDTGYGLANLKEEVRKITDKELIVVDSHSHMDHTCGSYQFDCVYITKEDYDDCLYYNSKLWRERNIKAARNRKILPEDFNEEEYLNAPVGNFKFLEIGDVFNLGDLNLEVVALEGHTKGSIGLLIKEERILLANDALGPFVWLFMKESTTVREYIEMCKRTMKLEFDYFYAGHSLLKFNKELIIDFIKVAEEIDVERSEKVVFPNFEDLNSYAFSINGKVYTQGAIGLLYDPDKLK